MGFDAGSISFRRFAVIGDAPSAVDQSTLDALAAHVIEVTEAGVPDAEEYGWCGGRHILDTTFSFENNVYNDCAVFGLRLDTNRVPSELTKAYLAMEEDAAAKGNPSGFISKLQKRDAKGNVQQKLDAELRSGKFRRSKMLPILWDLPAGILYCSASSSVVEKLLELFERTLGCTLEPVSAGTMASRFAQSKSKRRDYEDAHPTRFAHGPEGERQTPDYPWTAKGDEAKDYFGNEFLLWVWYQIDSHDGAITDDPSEITAMLDRTLDLDCAFGATGRAVLRNDSVAKMPEAMDAIRTGKVPRKAGLIIHAHGQQFTLSVAAENLSVTGLKLPQVEEADSPRILFEERITLLRDFCKAFDGMYEAFLKVRLGGSWEGQTSAIRKWIKQAAPRTVAAALA